MTNDGDEVMCVLRISTNNENLERVLQKFPRQRIDASWRSGDVVHGGPPRLTAGVNVFLTEKGTARAAIQRTFVLLEARKEVFHELAMMGSEVSIDFGVSVDPEVWTRSADFSVEQLARLVELKVGLTVSAYASGPDPRQHESRSVDSVDVQTAPPMTRSAADEGEDDANKDDEGRGDDDEGK